MVEPSPDRTLLLLCRHAEQRTMLELDPALSARGEAQAARLAKRLSELPVTTVVSSPLRRAQQTAAATADVLGLEVVTHLDLDEIRFTADANKEVFARTSARHMEPDVDDYASTAMAAVHAVPRFVWGGNGRGETGEQLRGRSDVALAEVVAEHGGGVVAVFTHGGFISAAIGGWLGIGRDMWLVPWHTSVSTVLVTPDDKVVIGVNDASHLYPDEDPLGIVTRAIGARL